MSSRFDTDHAKPFRRGRSEDTEQLPKDETGFISAQRSYFDQSKFLRKFPQQSVCRHKRPLESVSYDPSH
jgi:hypothetical protein